MAGTSRASSGRGGGGAVATTAAPSAAGSLNATLQQRLDALFAAAPGGISITSGFRTRAEQEQLYADYLNGTGNMAAKPGTSFHEQGMAADLNFASDATQQWVHDHAAEYGLTFPISGEPWHVELIDGPRAGGSGGEGAVGYAGTYVGGQFAPLPEVDPRAFAQQQYGYLAAYLDDAEIGPIILQAAKEGWDISRLQGALYQTDWWWTHADTARTFDAQMATDPASTRQRIEAAKHSILAQATQMGVTITDARAIEIATASLRSGWSPEFLRLTISSEAKWQGPGTIMPGDIGSLQIEMQKLAATYMVPISDETAFWWAQQIAQGSRTMDGAKAAFTSLSVGRFPQLADLINQGITPGDYFGPYKELIARTLEVSPDSIDFDDPKWMQVTEFSDDGKIRPMTLSEASKLAREQPEWTSTRMAQQQGGDLTTSLLETFGAIRG